MYGIGPIVGYRGLEWIPVVCDREVCAAATSKLFQSSYMSVYYKLSKKTCVFLQDSIDSQLYALQDLSLTVANAYYCITEQAPIDAIEHPDAQPKYSLPSRTRTYSYIYTYVYIHPSGSRLFKS
jgi:hypothetical protein